MKTTIKLGGGKTLAIEPADNGTILIQFGGDGRESFAHLTLDAAGVLGFALEKAAERIEVTQCRNEVLA